MSSTQYDGYIGQNDKLEGPAAQIFKECHQKLETVREARKQKLVEQRHLFESQITSTTTTDTINQLTQHTRSSISD